MAEQIRLLVIEDVPQVASHMRSLLTSQSQIKMLDVIASGDQALAGISEFRPDVVIVDALLQGKVGGLDVAARVRGADPSVSIIVLTVPQHPVAEDPARGIDGVLRMPFSGFDLTTIVRRVHDNHAGDPAHAGSSVITLFSPKGGVGRTTLAYNLAVALGASRRVCLVDGSLQFSDLRGLLRVPANAPSIANLPIDRIRESDLAEVTWRDASGIDVLLAPPRIETAEMITVADLEKAVSILRQVYDLVVIDTRAGLTDDVLAFLDSADLVLQVVTYDSMAIRSAAMAGEAFAAIGYPPDKMMTVLNRADSSGGMTRAELETAIGARIHHEIVSDGRLVVAANNDGIAFVTGSPDAEVSVGIRRMADAIAARLGARSPALVRP